MVNYNEQLNEKLLGYNSNTNIINEETYKVIAGQTINTIANALSKSLGYYGSTTVIEDNSFNSFVTKDGYNILKKIKFDGSISTSILRFIMGISMELVKEVGDGSTSSVLVARDLYSKLHSELSDGKLEYYSRKEISNALNDIVKDISEKIKEQAVEINEDNFDVLKSIASVSNNNDEDLGELVYNIYKEIGKEGFIFPELSSTGEDYYEITEGLETSFGYEDKVQANQPNGFDLLFKDPMVVCIDGAVENVDNIDNHFLIRLMEEVCVKLGKPLVIVAHSYDHEVVKLINTNILSNRHKGGHHAVNPELKVALTRFDKNRPEEYKDLAAFLGTKLIDKPWEDQEVFYENAVKLME